MRGIGVIATAAIQVLPRPDDLQGELPSGVVGANVSDRLLVCTTERGLTSKAPIENNIPEPLCSTVAINVDMVGPPVSEAAIKYDVSEPLCSTAAFNADTSSDAYKQWEEYHASVRWHAQRDLDKAAETRRQLERVDALLSCCRRIGGANAKHSVSK